MEWVTTTGRSIEEAKELALDQLGVMVDDAEFEVIEEPRSGLFGRMRGEAKVRARVRPTPVRAKVERKDRRRKADDAPSSDTPREPVARKEPRPKKGNVMTNEQEPVTAAVSSSPEPAASAPERGPRAPSGSSRGRSDRSDRPERVDVDPKLVGAEAERFMHGLLDAFGLEGSTEVRQDGDDLEVLVTGDDLGLLIGPKGNTLLAVQDLVRVASQRRLGDHTTHLRIDIGGYRERRREALSRFTVQQVDMVKESGRARILEPMPSADRKVIHDTVASLDGVVSRSEGDDPHRRVVIAPSGNA